jgi:hypothetical protein
VPGLVVMRAEGVLPSLLPVVPGLDLSMAASMHKEELLRRGDTGLAR